MAASTARTVGILVLALLLLAALGLGLFALLRSRGIAGPVPGEERCVATASNHSTTLDLEQSHYASIIVGVSVRRGLAPRAASIALATAYQESGIRNLDYGDRDSLGLFQQRPSQGWGTRKQILDPYYATGRFYSALVKIKNWETADINDVAQRVQRSGFPEAYRDHEKDGRTVASALTGQSRGGFTCLERQGRAGRASALVKSLEKTFGQLGAEADGKVVRIDADSATLAWAYGSFALANSGPYGVQTIKVDGQQWTSAAFNLPEWTGATPALGSKKVEITVR